MGWNIDAEAKFDLPFLLLGRIENVNPDSVRRDLLGRSERMGGDGDGCNPPAATTTAALLEKQKSYRPHISVWTSLNFATPVATSKTELQTLCVAHPPNYLSFKRRSRAAMTSI